MSSELGVVVLAAGRGTRFPGVSSKVLVPLAGRSLVRHVLAAVDALAPARVVVVVGHGRDAVESELAGEAVAFAVQKEPRGTGHALLAAAEAIGREPGALLVLNGDVPLIRPTTLQALHRRLVDTDSACVLVSAELDEPGAYGRIVRTPDGQVEAIVEAADASPDTLRIKEINVGSYAFRTPDVFDVLRGVGTDNAQGEVYLTDAVKIFVERGRRVEALLLEDPVEGQGINTPDELAELELAYARR